MSIFGRKKDDGTEANDGLVPSRDAELAVPTFRAPAANSAPVGLPPKPAAPTLPVAGAPPRPAAGPGTVAPPRPSAQERRTLVVGRGIALQGTVADAERLVVEGTVESQMIQAAELQIAQTGVFRGEVQVEDAEIAGVFDGTVTARGNLIIRASGTVKGVARCKRLSVEEGGKIMGSMEMLQGEG
ncbi:polymer-forming cytoskeletal protein [Sabulicella rubraurantiaca]|uniref:polymer-forming cytoskeletal protein n=1 Tax=Sabulicella rubraurantiaca TaxID=2811429 RepID=UPI001A965074|nr:polymer-forming cytoskeletal protein [Sabulicella rubraurantiaca]